MTSIRAKTGLILGLLMASATFAANLPDLGAAERDAAQQGKDVYILFTGPSWCYYCQQLEDKVLSQPGVKDAIGKDFVIFESIYDRLSHKPEDQPAIEAHLKLAAQFHVSGYPTLVLATADGKEYFRQTGFPGQTPDAYLKMLTDAKQTRTTRDSMLALADRAAAEENLAEKTKLLEEAYAEIGEGATDPMLVPALWKLAEIGKKGGVDAEIVLKYRAIAALVEVRQVDPWSNPDRAIEVTSVLLDEVKQTDPKSRDLLLGKRSIAYYVKQQYALCLADLKAQKEVDPKPDEVQAEIDQIQKQANQPAH